MICAGKVHSGLQDVPATLCSNFVLVNEGNAGPVCITILPS